MTRDVLRLSSTEAATHEEVFEARYAGLVARARNLGVDRAEAEDLVHDAYVLFVLARPDLATIANLDGYLFVIVRHLHVSNVRRAARFRSEPLSTIDYDSAQLSWRDAHPLLRSERREALVRICHYATLRAPSSKAGSALLLRYFLGFYPAEIAKLLVGTARNIDDLLIEARREARAYLANPRQLAFLRSSAASPPLIDPVGDDGPSFLDRVRATIFRQAHEMCFSAAFFVNAYGSDAKSEAFDAEVAARLATCPRCLDEACRRLGLPRLAERFPTDTLGPSSRSRGSGFGAGGTSRVRASLRRRMTDTLEHRPRCLYIAVNGLSVESHRIGSEVIDHTLTLISEAPLSFVEVLSDQGVRLALLHIEPFPDGALRQAAHVELSLGSTLDLAIDFAEHRPTFHIVYRPAMEPASVVAERWRDGAVSWPSTSRQPDQRGVAARILDWLHDWRPGARAVLVAVTIAAVVWLGTSTGAAAVLRDAVRAVVSAIDGMLRPTAPIPPPPPPSPRLQLPAPLPLRHDVPVLESAVSRLRVNAIDLEIEALWKLHQVGALLGEQVSIERQRGQLLIDARVETDARREELQRALSSVADRGARVRVDTFQQAAAVAADDLAPPRAMAYSVGVAADRFAAAALVRRHFVAQFGLEEDPRVAVAVRDYAAYAQDTARRVALHAFALQRILRRLPAAADADVSAEARVTHGVLVREYAGTVERWAGELAGHLQTVFGVSEHPRGAAEGDISGQASALDAEVRNVFGVQLGEDVAVDGAPLVRLARRVERLASEIRQQSSP